MCNPIHQAVCSSSGDEPMQVKLVVANGKQAEKKIPVTGPKFLIGRGEGCQLRPQSTGVSRKHCVILVEEATVDHQGLRQHERHVRQRPKDHRAAAVERRRSNPRGDVGIAGPVDRGRGRRKEAQGPQRSGGGRPHRRLAARRAATTSTSAVGSPATARSNLPCRANNWRPPATRSWARAWSTQPPSPRPTWRRRKRKRRRRGRRRKARQTPSYPRQADRRRQRHGRRRRAVALAPSTKGVTQETAVKINVADHSVGDRSLKGVLAL